MATQTASSTRETRRSERYFYDPTHEFQGENVRRTDTPETTLTEYPNRPAPDISVVCEKCKCFISLTNLREHRLYHSALNILHYHNDEPQNLELLLRRRNFLLKKMKSSTKNDSITPQKIQEINEAYEYLKVQLADKYEELCQVHEDVNSHVGGSALNCSPDCVYAVGIVASANERWKSYMEDARTFQDVFGEDPHKCFFGLYDGYHGRFAAEVAASELHKLLLSEMIKFDPRTKTVMAGNLASEMDISHYKFERPDTRLSERAVLYDESVGIIQNIVKICEEKYNELIKKIDTPENSAKEDKTGNLTKRKKKQKSPFEQKMANAFSKAYYLLDILLSYGKDEHSKIRWSGCSATTCVIQDKYEDKAVDAGGDKETGILIQDNASIVSIAGDLEPPRTIGMIHLANAGNVHAVLVRGNHAYTLTKDHTAENKKEKNRVLRDGGTLSEGTKAVLVNGVLLTTRGLGNHGDLKLKKCVIVEPYTTSVPIDQYAQFLILATRGVWEVLTAKEAASLLIRLLPANQIPAPSKINSSLNPLFDALKCGQVKEQGSRRVSFSSVDTNVYRNNADTHVRKISVEQVISARLRSVTLESVIEYQAEDQLQLSDKGNDTDTKANSENENENTEDMEVMSENEHFITSAFKDHNRMAISHSSEGHKSIASNIMQRDKQKDANEPNNFNSESKPSGKSSRKPRRHIDTDMQTEIGSFNGDEGSGTESGNEGDIDSYLDNISFPGGISRISAVDGPPSREQLQRNQAQLMAQHLVQAALLAGAKDNVTVMVVLLPGCGL